MPIDDKALYEILTRANQASADRSPSEVTLKAMRDVVAAIDGEMQAVRKMLEEATAQNIFYATHRTGIPPGAVSLDRQIQCVRRELAMRKNVYPKWVANKRMKQEAADAEISSLQAVHDTLTKVQELQTGAAPLLQAAQ